MISNELKIVQVTPSELEKVIMAGIMQGLQAHEEQKGKQEAHDELLTIDETAKILKVSRGTILNLTNKGALKKYGMGRRVYYKRSEVENALTCLGK